MVIKCAMLHLKPADPIVFTANPLYRAENERRDEGWLAARLADPESRFLPLWNLRGLIALAPAPHLAWLPREAIAGWLDAGAAPVLLGLEEGRARFALGLDGEDNPAKGGPLDGRGKFIDVRSIAPSLPAPEAGILAQARSLVDWHSRHGFCAACGHATEPAEGGACRRCRNPSCETLHFPRTDPVVIMLVARGDRVLLGRQPQFAPGSYSALAGFVSQGESIEEAVRREVLEEAGIPCGTVRYLASQPWPFPSSLMIGCIAEALDDTVRIDRQELEDARWFSRDELAAMAERSLGAEAPRLAPPLSLAHQIALRWLAETGTEAGAGEDA